MGKNILITGATGLVGGGVLARVIDSQSFDTLYILLRDRRKKAAGDRLNTLIEQLIPPQLHELARQKLRVVSGDVSKGDLGLSAENRAEIIQNVDQILHCSANTTFTAPMDELNKSNREATRRLLNLALEIKEERGEFTRFDFVSTAYVAGSTVGEPSEEDLERGQEFSNNYERSKYEAEKVAYTYREHFPVTVLRPSIIAGQSDNGYTPHFRVLYWPLMLVAKGLIPVVPCNKKAKLDVVPSDYVCEGIIAMIQTDESLNETIYLAAGKGNEITVGQVLRDAEKHGIIQCRPKIPKQIWYTLKDTSLNKLFPSGFWDLIEQAEPYGSYLFGTGVRFDNRKSVALLERHGIKLPEWSIYHNHIFNYAEVTEWGKSRDQLPAHYYIFSERKAAQKAVVEKARRWLFQRKTTSSKAKEYGLTDGKSGRRSMGKKIVLFESNR